ncbi:MAG TPA: PspC domain-containing protein [Thermoanaerobaculia bacterium]|nr:PspC domain-containing protein [Thermoanaerobaculia bacterium]
MALYRSRNHKILGGVCGGLADWLGWSPTLVRVLYVIVSIASAGFPGALVYLILWFFMPKAPRGAQWAT